MVNGLFLCWGDVSAEVCRNCVAFVVKDTLDRCPEEEKVVLYYDQCMVRYSNRNILSTVNTEGSLVLKNTKNVTSNKKDRFRDLVSTYTFTFLLICCTFDIYLYEFIKKIIQITLFDLNIF